MSGGVFASGVYGGNELVPALEAFDTVRTGGAEIGSGAAYYYGQGAGSPVLRLRALRHERPATQCLDHRRRWFATWEELYRDFNLVPMAGGNTGVQMGLVQPGDQQYPGPKRAEDAHP